VLARLGALVQKVQQLEFPHGSPNGPHVAIGVASNSWKARVDISALIVGIMGQFKRHML
jgi:hypothetical protein